ncbi:Putative two-component response regulator protein (fragment) [Agrobacterium tumefaciens str. Kerr 14]|uniref:Putative two-component response regulator protein n=1 Tax=Agrobacterium tumefaciens str. Kerr 14 TaxID=1183424 RepID=A0A1S7SF31_AGRTU
MIPQQILSGRPVLVVEDDYQLAMALTRQLSELGAVVLGPSSNVEDALRQIASTDDLAGAILDANLGEEMVFPVADDSNASTSLSCSRQVMNPM